MLRKLVFFVLCLGVLQFIAVDETLAVMVGIDLKKSQTLTLLYNQPIPDSLYGEGENKHVNAFEFTLFFEVCSNDTLASIKLYSDSNEVLWEFTGPVEVPQEVTGSCNASYMFDFYDQSVWGPPYHDSTPAIDINQFRDGIGADNLLVSVTILEGSLRIKEYEFSYKHTESSSSSSALGTYDMNLEHYDFNFLPVPSVSLSMILLLIFN